MAFVLFYLPTEYTDQELVTVKYNPNTSMRQERIRPRTSEARMLLLWAPNPKAAALLSVSKTMVRVSRVT